MAFFRLAGKVLRLHPVYEYLPYRLTAELACQGNTLSSLTSLTPPKVHRTLYDPDKEQAHT